MKRALLFFLVLASFNLSACSIIGDNTTSPAATSSPSVTNSSPTPLITPWPETGVSVQKPQPNEPVTSPFLIAGEAPGTWFFEGQMTAEIQNEQGLVLATIPLTAEGNWMTEELVAFSGTASYPEKDVGDQIILVIKNDNPSGLPENEKSVSFSFATGKKL